MKVLTRRMASTVVLAFITTGALCYANQYRQYAYAYIWHWRHGDVLKAGTDTINIPDLWWAERADSMGRFTLRRSCKLSQFVEPKIEVVPAAPEDMAATADEQLRIAQAVVSDMIRNPQSGWNYSVVNIDSVKAMWHCVEEEQHIMGHHIFTSLSCHAPRADHSLQFQGPPEQEAEAEQIIRTFQ